MRVELDFRDCQLVFRSLSGLWIHVVIEWRWAAVVEGVAELEVVETGEEEWIEVVGVEWTEGTTWDIEVEIVMECLVDL